MLFYNVLSYIPVIPLPHNYANMALYNSHSAHCFCLLFTAHLVLFLMKDLSDAPLFVTAAFPPNPTTTPVSTADLPLPFRPTIKLTLGPKWNSKYGWHMKFLSVSRSMMPYWASVCKVKILINETCYVWFIHVYIYEIEHTYQVYLIYIPPMVIQPEKIDFCRFM